jgi:monovalent cation/proton antiporter MnhG/PhaG subunit
MSLQDALTYALLAVGVVLELLACLGIAVMEDVYDRLHFLPPATLGAIAIGAAILMEAGASMIALKAGLVVLFLLAAAPGVAHVTARAARIHDLGDWRAAQGEGIEVEDA